MDGYLCVKPTRLFGVKYLPGDSIPAEAVMESRVATLKKQGRIADQLSQPEEPSLGEPKFPLPILLDSEENAAILLTASEIAEVILLRQLPAEEAAAKAAELESCNMLLLLAALESRKTVKTVIEARQADLQKPGGGA